MTTRSDSSKEDSIQQWTVAFNNCGYEGVLNCVTEQGYAAMSDALCEAASKAELEDNKVGAKMLMLLAKACSMELSSDKPTEPFELRFAGTGRRLIIPDDFTDFEIEFFAGILDSVDNPLLNGRLADLVWDRRLPRDPAFALAAIDSYTQIPIHESTWFADVEQCWKRAIGLCRMIGAKASDHLDQIEVSLIAVIDSSTTDVGFFTLRLADTLRSYGLGRSQSDAIGRKLESLAIDFGEQCNFHASESFYGAAAKWFEDASDNDKSIDMIVAQAEAFVSDATNRISSDNPSYGVGASFLENAIQVFRRIPRVHRDRHQVDQRIRDLRIQLSEYGQRAQDEMVTSRGHEIDLSDSVRQARNSITGKPLHEAIGAFANLHGVSYKKLREDAIESLIRFPFLAMIPKVFSTQDGRVIDRTPGIKGSSPTEEDEEAIRAQMNHPHYSILVGVAVQGSILPALEVLTLEHRITGAGLIELARRSPIVPLGREVQFGKALAEGFNQDFVTSIHLLAPQIEHMVRYHLKSAGASTTRLDQEGLETENGLNALMELSETSTIFGEDLSYELRALFCDQVGPNLRNKIAHGLFDDREFPSAEAVYAWWLGVKLVFNTFWNSMATQPEREREGRKAEDDSKSC